ncbi:hypothetical protein HYPSUDRAFT_208281 [Hypholoma sublateritium FD-334 SS-4]|uniref:Uncharacterized protein n=1 Tax=Hypholoma sublateritium (strain FD-334 SS-4) TaxID=945553 RepID=A0A0D2NE92_HYPSF|nr:hypothetical protein HYPSUDRAFT_208281 [Hypholoma sublateritium FD-334 SS-4]
MEHDWVPPQPLSSQLPPGSLEPAPALFLREPAVPHRESFGSHNMNLPNQTPYSQLMLAPNMSTSESTRSLLQDSQSSASNGHSASIWSSFESFPSGAGPTPEQYRALSYQLNNTKRENLELIRNNSVLSAKLDTLAKAYELLANRIPQILDSTPAQGAKEETREMYPNVKFWTRQEWIAANTDRVADLDEGVNTGTRGRTRAAQGINVNMRYIEDRDGQPVNGHLASDIRRHARAVFVGLAQKGHLFASWSEADHDSLKTYYREMAQRFEELRFCAHDWKAEMVALDIYRTWRDQWQKRERKRKQTGKKSKNDQFEDDKDGDESDHSDEEDSVKHSINHGTSENERATKKSKVGNSLSDANVAIPYANPAAEMQPKLVLPIINGMPGAPVQADVTKTGFHYEMPQPVPSLQRSFDIINPLQSSSNTLPVGHPFVPMAPVFVPAPSNAGPAQPLAPAAKSRRMRPTKSITARNLCAIDWCKQNKGTAEDFNKFWNDLSKDEKERYEALSKERSEQEKVPT